MFFCLAILKRRSRFLICRFRNAVTHGFCLEVVFLLLVGIATLAALSMVSVNSSVAVSISFSNMRCQSVSMSSLVSSGASMLAKSHISLVLSVLSGGGVSLSVTNMGK